MNSANQLATEPFTRSKGVLNVLMASAVAVGYAVHPFHLHRVDEHTVLRPEDRDAKFLPRMAVLAGGFPDIAVIGHA